MRRRFVLAVVLIGLAAGAYAAWPAWTAWSIRNAIRTNDTAYLERAVEWPSVKETLKPSLIDIALGPAEESPDNPGLWTRLKAYAGERSVESLVERLATPEGLPLLFAYGKAYRERVKGQFDDTADLPLPERMARAWARVKRARFTSLTRFEVEVADKFTPERHYDGVLELRGLTWKLTELRIRMRKDEAPGE